MYLVSLCIALRECWVTVEDMSSLRLSVCVGYDSVNSVDRDGLILGKHAVK